MKKTNKGFSMVELIIVIAIMAILAGALAPALIKYINKSRLSTDIQTANSIGTAVQTALANETGYDDASEHWSGTFKAVSADVYQSTNSPFAKSVMDTLGKKAPKAKAKKCMNKTTPIDYGGEFYIWVDPVGNQAYVLVGKNAAPGGNPTSGFTDCHVLYPTASKCLTDDSVTSCN